MSFGASTRSSLEVVETHEAPKTPISPLRSPKVSQFLKVSLPVPPRGNGFNARLQLVLKERGKKQQVSKSCLLVTQSQSQEGFYCRHATRLP